MSAPSKKKPNPFVKDTNKNGIFDAADVLGVRYNSVKFAKFLAARPEKIIVMGEDHESRPLETILRTIQAMRKAGKSVIYTIELSKDLFQLSGRDILALLNRQVISPAQFKKILLASLPADMAPDISRMADDILRVHAAGARIEAIDADLRDLQSMLDNKNVRNVNRDQLMSETILALRDAHPDATILAESGGLHAQVHANMKHDLAGTDQKNPMTKRLVDRLGKNQVLSVYNYATTPGFFSPYMVVDNYLNGRLPNLPFNTWDMFLPSQG